ncbi:dihydrofolate reductase family protein [Leucobacter allii]|uniref:Dihydrofolate reductase family protein n=1 Tax=Leucobacter allii TaxID=2932247 RepID=A0ABY4FQQ9_9MICO|nr:dihydrofolate reductase family protein [Leucobacter allii]UOQ58603.1 dihydrofolate reductase family protein [Leucobacter allii]UOR03127.1 dihydrofolate reductase family protein [Leucobacter allii]
MTRVRVHNLALSLDGFGTGVDQRLESPFGHAGTRLMEWFFPTPTFQAQTGDRERRPVDPAAAADDVFARRGFEGIGAEIMGSRKFGPPGWPDDPDWRGWWGEEPPFRTPVLVLTHTPREPVVFPNGTEFRFLSAEPREALARATELADGLDVRIGGGPSTVRAFLAAGLVDLLHVVQVPVILGRGERLWDGLEGLERGYDIEATTTPSGVTHLVFSRE